MSFVDAGREGGDLRRGRDAMREVVEGPGDILWRTWDAPLRDTNQKLLFLLTLAELPCLCWVLCIVADNSGVQLLEWQECASHWQHYHHHLQLILSFVTRLTLMKLIKPNCLTFKKDVECEIDNMNKANFFLFFEKIIKRRASFPGQLSLLTNSFPILPLYTFNISTILAACSMLVTLWAFSFSPKFTTKKHKSKSVGWGGWSRAVLRMFKRQ